MPLTQLFELEEDLVALKGDPTWIFVSVALEGEAEGELDYLDDRKDISHVEYARLHGKRAGLVRADSLISEVIEYARKRRAEQEQSEVTGPVLEAVRS
jgi:hypothetical protein